MPDGKDFLRLPVKFGYIKFTELKDGSIDLADLAEMNEWIDIEQDNEARIARWRNHHGEC
ncbi:NTP pyrophosphohydrolase [Arsenophonus sp. ENCA]|uniref:DUF6889 family protein n=1 Tax=Arsenophonus sp. ENCA TaxID=1987579 RepID=UPI000BC9D2FF|nr:NTP pyrophosphohydrolase [Arsenophonus sp. ENCA]PAV10826.1 NTP pyrophosphohydrolase [Arsenophonus sp. ENCA]